MPAGTIAEITLKGHAARRRTPEIERERETALRDLLAASRFAPAGPEAGPYRVFLSVSENRLRLDVHSDRLAKPYPCALPVAPFRRVIKDYFLICESYFEAVKSGQAHRIEAVDMGRRGVHNEGAELLQSLLAGKIETDFETARRLFTLICVLHIK